MVYYNHGDYYDPPPPPSPTQGDKVDSSTITFRRDNNTIIIQAELEPLQAQLAVAEPAPFPIQVRFELVKTDSNNNLIIDSDPYNDARGLFVGAVINLVYLEYRNGDSADPTYSYSPGKGVNLEAKKSDSGDICYAIILPLSSDKNSDSSFLQFSSEKFSKSTGDVADLFNCKVDCSRIPEGKVDLAVNDLCFIIDQEILALSDEITKEQ